MTQTEQTSFDTQNRTEQLIQAFEAEGPFSWGRYYTRDQYVKFKQLLQECDGYIAGESPSNNWRCMVCEAPVFVGAIIMLLPNGRGGRTTVTLIDKYRDHYCEPD